MECGRAVTLLFLTSFLILHLTSSSVRADADDDYWKGRENEAEKAAREAYVPDPFKVTSSFNAAVNKDAAEEGKGQKTSRRSLMAAGGEAMPADDADDGSVVETGGQEAPADDADDGSAAETDGQEAPGQAHISG